MKISAMPAKTVLRHALSGAFAAMAWHSPALPAAEHYNLPICRANGHQTAPMILADGSGGAYILWLDSRASQSKIFCQRLNPLGQPAWPAQGQAIANTPGRHERFAAMADAEGLLIVWQESAGSDDGDIHAQRLHHTGARLWGEGGKEIYRGSREQAFPLVIADGTGGAIALWQDERSGNWDIFAQRLDANGDKQWHAAGVALIAESRDQLLGEAVAIPGQGFGLAWRDERISPARVLAQRFDLDGNKIWNEAVWVAASATDQSEPKLAWDAGAMYVAWIDRRASISNVYAQRLSAAGVLQWGPLGLAAAKTSDEQKEAQLLANPAGGIFLIWEDARHDKGDIYAQHLNSEGRQMWSPAGLALMQAEQGQYRPRAAVESAGGLLCAWEDDRGSGTNIAAQRVDAAGNLLWPAEGVMLTNHGDKTFAPVILSRDNGRALVVWTDSRNPNDDIYAQPLAGTGGFENVPPAITSSAPTVAYLNTAYDYAITSMDYDSGEAPALALVAAPPWLKLDQAAQALHGIPGANDRGEFQVQIQAQDAAGGMARQDFLLQVRADPASPQIASQPDTLVNEDALYHYQVQAFDPDPQEALQFKLETAAAWLALSAQGVLSGTPLNEHVGRHAVKIIVTNRKGKSDQQQFVLTVLNTNDAPQIVSSPPLAVKEDSLYRYAMALADPDPDETLKLLLLQAPVWLQLDTAARVLSGRPRNAHVGEHTVVLEVRDRSDAAAQQRFSVRVENTNDAPVFVSTPDTVAFVDSLYEYRPVAQDVDAGDRVTLTVMAAPAWLTWEAASKTLRGIPRPPHAGAATVILRAQDLAQAAAVQQFSLRVYNLGAPDASAPDSPQNASVSPANWSRSENFTVRWQNPFDPSGIAGAFYKIGAPPDSNRDGKLVAPAAGQTLQEIKLQAPRAGRIPVYLWLLDGSGNLDYKTAARVDYRYDASAPRPAAQLRAGNARAWANGDTIRFAWQAARDSISGVARLDLILAGKTIRRLPGAASGFALDTLLAEKKFTWHLVAVDSADNAAASASASFRVDRTPPAVTHAPPDTIAAGEPFTLRAAARDPLAGIAAVRVRYRTPGAASFSEIAMSADGDGFIAALPGAAIQSPGLQYVIVAMDSADNAGASTGGANPGAVHAVVVKSQQIIAPQATRGEYYQLISIPYRLSRRTPAEIFADNFGAYDPRRWRLYAYAPAEGNIEFGKDSFQQIEPGRAYWLITAKPQNFDAGAGVSLSTAQAFTMELQPGWNLIATPFDFPTDWRAVQKPTAVESQLWAFTGRQYLAHDNIMQPWQGYFVRNLSAQPQTLAIPPCGDCAGGFSPNPGNGAVTRIQAGAPPEARNNGAQELYTWRLQLQVHDGEFADTQNWLGVSALAQEEWDPLDLSEPPPAAGDFVALHFPQRQWKNFNGDFAADYRPPAKALEAAAGVKKWIFEIHAARAGKALFLDFHRSGAIPQNWRLLLQNENENWLRQIDFDEDGRSQTIALRSSAAPRRFVLWAGAREELDKSGMFAAALPQAFALTPGYPNPARISAHHQAVITMRFSLPVAAPVDLGIWDVLGRPVRTLLRREPFTAGHHEILWNGRDDTGRAVAAGVYFCRIRAGQFNAMQKIILLQ